MSTISTPTPTVIPTDIRIAVLNSSTIATDAQVQAMIPALQMQWNRDLVPAWGVNECVLSFVPKGVRPAAGSWWLVFLDDADQAGALAYHDVTSDGMPISKVFARTARDDGASLSVCASHELCEMAVDPDCARIAQAVTGTLYALETADPVESDEFGYSINGVLVSDFVLPRWFGLSTGAKGVYDFCKRVKRPYQILSGGYAQSFDPEYGWQQLSREATKAKALSPSVGSRRERRKRGRLEWQRSEPRDRTAGDEHVVL